MNELGRHVQRHGLELAERHTLPEDLTHLDGHPAVSDADPLLGCRREAWELSVQDQTQHRVAGNELDHPFCQYRQALDRSNTNNYVLPLSNVPLIFTHVADLTIAEGSLGAYGAEVYDFNWK